PAEDGIRDRNVTGVQTCALPIFFGTSSVKGFATLLIISIFISFITAVFGTRLLLSLWIKTKFLKNRPGLFGVKKATIRDIKDTGEAEPTLFKQQVNIVQHRQ